VLDRPALAGLVLEAELVPDELGLALADGLGLVDELALADGLGLTDGLGLAAGLALADGLAPTDGVCRGMARAGVFDAQLAAGFP